MNRNITYIGALESDEILLGRTLDVQQRNTFFEITPSTTRTSLGNF